MVYILSGEEYRFILFISFDLDAESAEIFRGSDPNTLSRGRFAIYRGIYKVLDVLKKRGVKSTFFTPSWVIENYPHVIEEIVSREHEIAAHGYLHERLDQLDFSQEKIVFEKTDKLFKEIIGYPPVGFRSPYWRWSKNTIEFLTGYGYRYDSSLMDDEYPYILKYRDKELIEFPVDWRFDDWPYLEYYRTMTPQQLLEQWIDEIQYASGINGFISITMHPQCIGRGSRIRILEKIIDFGLKSNALITCGKVLVNYMEKLHRENKVVIRVFPSYNY